MDQVSGFLTNYPFIAENKYLLIFIIATLEGFSSILFAGFLVSINVLSLVPTFFVLFASENLNGFLWYGVGYWGGAKSLEWFVKGNVKKKRFLERVRHYFDHYAGWAILLAKMTFSVTIITQIFVGSLKYNLKKFSIFNLIGSLVWVIIVLAAGYFFGEGYKVFFQYWENISHLVIYTILGIVIIYMIRIALRNVVIDFMALVDKFDSTTKDVHKWLNKGFKDPEDRH